MKAHISSDCERALAQITSVIESSATLSKEEGAGTAKAWLSSAHAANFLDECDRQPEARTCVAGATNAAATAACLSSFGIVIYLQSDCERAMENMVSVMEKSTKLSAEEKKKMVEESKNEAKKKEFMDECKKRPEMAKCLSAAEDDAGIMGCMMAGAAGEAAKEAKEAAKAAAEAAAKAIEDGKKAAEEPAKAAQAHKIRCESAIDKMIACSGEKAERLRETRADVIRECEEEVARGDTKDLNAVTECIDKSCADFAQCVRDATKR